MKYGLLVKSVHLEGKHYITAEEIKGICKTIGISYVDGIIYLTRTKNLIRILRGFFYVESPEERRTGIMNANFFDALSKALEHKEVSWYFGFDTAIKLNNLTHEYFPMDYVVSDKLFRPKPVAILGHKVKFIKLNKSLFGFGVKHDKEVNYSDIEKTILDIIHIRKHKGTEDAVIKNEISDLLRHASKKKLREYAEHYSLSVRNFVGMIS